MEIDEGEIKVPQVPDQNEVKSFSQGLVNYLIGAGICAPSGDNAQPWKFKAQEKKDFCLLR